MAWGAAPTVPEQATNSLDLWEKLRELLLKLTHAGITQEQLCAASLITPACGLGGLSENDAEHILNLLQPMSVLAREWAWSCS